MKACEWVDARSVGEAARLLSNGTDLVVAKAGGIDLIDLMKEGLIAPARIVNLRSIAGLDGIRIDEHGDLHIGALTTLAHIAREPLIRERYRALAAAADHAATPQIRNVATIGGNLLQRPRCWYFRNEHFDRRSVASAAREGQNQFHGIFETEITPLVHASTPATALLACGASVHVTSSRGSRSIAIGDLFLPPDATRASDVALRADEVLTHLTLPRPPDNTVSRYHKHTERDSYDWPICDVAVALRMTASRTVESASIALGWVAPTPRRAIAAEAVLSGRALDDTLAREAARAAVCDARPLAHNGHKVQILETVIRRTILAAADVS